MKEQQQEYNPECDKQDVASLLLQAQPVTGRCYVLTFSPKHDITLADMAAAEILPVIQTWTRIYGSHLSPSHPLKAQADKALASIPANPDGEVEPPKSQLRYMQIFENKGAAMGCSNPHPHCQVWTTSTLPEEPGKELVQMAKYKADNGRHLLEDYFKLEMEKQERVVWQNDGFLVVCPWWAVWPFEVLVIAKRHVRALVDLSDEERLQFAEAVQEVTRRYDNLFETNFPYSEHPLSEVGTISLLTRHRLRYSPSAAGLHRGGSRDQLVPHALLSASPPVSHRPQVPRWIRAHGRAAAGYHTRAGGCSSEELRWRAVPQAAGLMGMDAHLFIFCR